MKPDDRASGAHGFGPRDEQADIERIEWLDRELTALAHGAPGMRGTRPIPSGLAERIAAARALDSLAHAQPSDAFAARLRRELAQRQRARRALSRRHIPRFAWAAIAACLLLALTVFGTLTANAAPGAPLYPLRKEVETASGELTGAPTATAQADLEHARQALAAYDTAASQNDNPAALSALKQLTSDNRQTARAIQQVADGGARATLQSQFDTLKTQEITDLREGLEGLTWLTRVQVTSAINGLGSATLTITRIKISGGHGNGATGFKPNGQVTLIISGSGFAPNAALLINDQPAGTVDAVTPTSVIAHLPAAQAATIQSVGVGNLDGTAASLSDLNHSGHNS